MLVAYLVLTLYYRNYERIKKLTIRDIKWRIFKMKKLIVTLSMLLSLMGVAGFASASVISFDDVPGAVSTGNNNAVPNGYGGLNWNNMYVLHENYYTIIENVGYANGAVSGQWVAYNGYGGMAVTSAGDDFDFIGAYFTAAWYDDNVVTINGFDDGVLKFTIATALSTQTPLWVAANFTSIDRLEFTTSNWQFAMDDFTFNATAVPEPATLILLGLGLIGMAGLRRKSNK
jgi:hypothetical protein